jgi:hypothetical protein
MYLLALPKSNNVLSELLIILNRALMLWQLRPFRSARQ